MKWYEEKLGFKFMFDNGDDPMICAGVARQGLEIHLQFQYPDDMLSTDIRFAVRNIDLLFQEYIKSGIVKPDAMRRNTDWGTHEFGLFDLSGNRILFYEDV